MSNEIQLAKTRFSMKLEMQLQQMESKLRGKVEESSMTGSVRASPIQQLNAVVSKAPGGPGTPITFADNSYIRRWVTPIDRELAQLRDSFETLRTDIDTTGSLVKAASDACNRDFDDEIIRAATAVSQVGVDAGSLTNETFNTTLFQIASTFGAGAATGITIAKLIEAKRIMRKAQVNFDSEPLTLVMGSQQEADLLNQVEVTSADFNRQYSIQDGRLSRLFGFDIVVMERLPIVSANVRGCLAIAKSGIHLGVWRDMEVDVSQRKDLTGLSWQIYNKYTYGAARMQQGKVVQILCSDTTGADVTP